MTCPKACPPLKWVPVLWWLTYAFVGTKRFYADEAPQNLAKRDRFAFERNQKKSWAITAGKNNKSVSCWVDISILHIYLLNICIYIYIIHTHRHLDMHTCQYIHISATKHAKSFISDSLNQLKQTHPNTGKRSLPRNVAVRLLKLPLPWWSRVPQSWTTGELDNLYLHVGGKIPPFCFGQKKMEVLLHFRWFSGLKILGWNSWGERSRSCWGGRVGTSINNSTQRRDGLFYSVFSRVNPIYI